MNICWERSARQTSCKAPTSSQVTSGVVAKPSLRTEGWTQEMAASKSSIVIASPDISSSDNGSLLSPSDSPTYKLRWYQCKSLWGKTMPSTFWPTLSFMSIDTKTAFRAWQPFLENEDHCLEKNLKFIDFPLDGSTRTHQHRTDLLCVCQTS